MVVSDKIRAGIEASKGKLSQSATARKFGVSRRTVGRIFHGGELSPATAPESEVESLRKQVAQLAELVAALGSRGDAAAAPQRLRPALNPRLYEKNHQHWWVENRSPYSGVPGPIKVHIYGSDRQFPDYFKWQVKAEEEWFMLNNPASPECTEYPYPHTEPKNKPRYGREQKVEFKDPPTGVACVCKACKLWRRGMAYEHELVRLMPFGWIDVTLDAPGYRLAFD